MSGVAVGVTVRWYFVLMPNFPIFIYPLFFFTFTSHGRVSLSPLIPYSITFCPSLIDRTRRVAFGCCTSLFGEGLPHLKMRCESNLLRYSDIWRRAVNFWSQIFIKRRGRIRCTLSDKSQWVVASFKTLSRVFSARANECHKNLCRGNRCPPWIGTKYFPIASQGCCLSVLRNFLGFS